MATITVGEMLALGKSQRTAYAYVRLLDHAERFLAGRGKNLADCDPVDVALLTETVKKSHSSRGQLRAALQAAWTVLDRHDGPARAVRVPPRPRGRCRALEADSAALLEKAAWERNDNAGLAVLIGLYAGLRRSKIASVRFEDFERDDRGRPTWLVVMGKGEVVAEVPVHPVLAVALLRRWRPKGFLFAGRRGGPVNPDTIWRWTNQVASDAGLEVTTHVLRHTALAEANDRSGNLRTVQAFARHSRPEITSIYTRTTRAQLAQVVSMIDYGRHISGGEETGMAVTEKAVTEQLAEMLVEVWDACERKEAGNLSEVLSYALGAAAKTILRDRLHIALADIEPGADEADTLQQLAGDVLVVHRPGCWEAGLVRLLIFPVDLV